MIDQGIYRGFFAGRMCHEQVRVELRYTRDPKLPRPRRRRYRALRLARICIRRLYD